MFVFTLYKWLKKWRFSHHVKHGEDTTEDVAKHRSVDNHAKDPLGPTWATQFCDDYLQQMSLLRNIMAVNLCTYHSEPPVSFRLIFEQETPLLQQQFEQTAPRS